MTIKSLKRVLRFNFFRALAVEQNSRPKREDLRTKPIHMMISDREPWSIVEIETVIFVIANLTEKAYP